MDPNDLSEAGLAAAAAHADRLGRDWLGRWRAWRRRQGGLGACHKAETGYEAYFAALTTLRAMRRGADRRAHTPPQED